MAALAFYGPEFEEHMGGDTALEPPSAHSWMKQLLWDDPQCITSMNMEIPRGHDPSMKSTRELLRECQKLMEDESVFMEPTSVLDLQTSPGCSYSTATLSSQQSFTSKDVTSIQLQTVLDDILRDEHRSAVGEETDTSNTSADQDIINWMDCMADPSLLLPEFEGPGCHKKLNRPSLDDTGQFSKSGMGFAVGTNLDAVDTNRQQANSSASFAMTCDQEMTPEPSTCVIDDLRSHALARLENELLSDDFVENQLRWHQWSRGGISGSLPTMLNNLISFQSAKAQDYSVIPTSELLKLLSTQNGAVKIGSLTDMQRSCQSMKKNVLGSSNTISAERLAAMAERQVRADQKPILGQPRRTWSTIPQSPEAENGLLLVNLLLSCAEAIDQGEFDIARPLLTRVKSNSSSCGDPIQRIALYFGDALGERLTQHDLANNFDDIEFCGNYASLTIESDLAYQTFYQVLPFERFAHFTANQILFEAVASSPSVHVVDLDIRQGLQWPGFIQSLAVLPNGPPKLRITAVGSDSSTMRRTGNRLSEFAKSFHVPFEFRIVAENVENFDGGMLRLEPDEALAFNCSNILHTLLRNRGGLESLLRNIRNLNPIAVSLVEVDAKHNEPSFMRRFVDALHYYCALFDSLEATLDRGSSERLQIENIIFNGEIRDILTCEGTNRRVRHMRSETWQAHLRQAGFRELRMSSYTTDQAQLLLGLYHEASGEMRFKLSKVLGGLVLGWQDTPVTSVSSWTC